MAGLIESVLDSIYSMTKKSPQNYSSLETTIGKRTFVYRNQTMATVLRYTGIKRITGSAETELVTEHLADALNPFFARECHELQFVLDRDLMTQKEMKRRMQPTYESANAMGMGDMIGDILDEQAATLARTTMNDTIVLVLYTHTGVMNAEDFKAWCKEIIARRRAGEFYCPPGTQDETFAIEPMLALHDTFVDQIVSVINSQDVGGMCEVLNIDEASGLLRGLVDRRGTSENWKAWLMPQSEQELRERFATRRDGEPMLVPSPLRITKEKPKITKVGNASIFYPPPLAEQLIPASARYEKGGFEIGGRIYSTVNMVTAPRREVTAQQLTYSLSGMTTRVNGVTRRVPYRLSMRLRGCGLSQFQLRAMIAPLFSIGNQNNRKIHKAYSALQHDKEEQFAMGTLSVSLTTWVDSEEEGAAELLKSRVVALHGAATQWGDMTAAEDVLDRAKAFFASCAAISLDPCSNEATGNLYEVLPLMPWMRPASPLGTNGTDFYRTLDGAVLPCAQHSSVQDFWLSTMTAPMGGGKSAQANRQHFDFIFAPGRKSLPFLHCMDIGGSVAGMVYLIQDALPDNQKHLVKMVTLRNEARYCVNMLDPKLGLRYPLEADMQVTTDFLSALATPAERATPPDNMSEFARAVLLATYKRFDDGNDQGSPNLYERSFGDEEGDRIDAALANNNIDIPHGTSWYKVADKLIAAHCVEEALLAHRRAAPTMRDLMMVAQDANVNAEFMKALTEQGTPIPHAFDTQMALAANSFPIFFAGITKLDLRGCRVTAIDLQEVTGKGSASARKRAGLMYMVAYEMFAKNIRITEEDMAHIPVVWRDYYRSEIEHLKETDKHVTIDEYHRTDIAEGSSGTSLEDKDKTGIRATLVREGGRESRKWQLSLTTISQIAADHGTLLGLASNNIIIKRGSKEETEFQRQHIGLSPTDMRAMTLHVNGPKKGVGVTYLAQWITKSGTFNQLFTSTIGPKMLWSLSTTYEDKTVRSMVFDALGRVNGRAALAHLYPSGSAKDEVERRKREFTTGASSDFAQDSDLGAARLVAEEIISNFRRDPSKFATN